MRPVLNNGAAGAGVDSAAHPTVPLRPLRFAQLLDEPFALIQAHLRPLAIIGTATFGVAFTLALAATWAVADLTNKSDAAIAWTAILSTLAAFWLARLVIRGTTTAIGVADYAGINMTTTAALHAATHHAGPLLVAQLLSSLIGIGIIALGLPLVITFPFALVWLAWVRARRFVIDPVIVGENASAGVAARRSRELVAPATWSTAGVWFTLRALFAVLIVPIFAIPLFASDFTGTHLWGVIALSIGAFLLLATVCTVVESATQVVVYFHRRCVREGIDIKIPVGGTR
ncbi:hypothetical protein [Nocardia camponoti]|uniref:Glycerophosphoryl diester phosphodiesterase membrane domain-containing protein n=1 Tax=Nocardia camponoti TaxID=1616106 RepID=A0A917VAP5_9NOCA|nr:hypothetical protein [Nocardia camponoti]GGK54985.1 hypothetical protein GCM10011591_28600 [Nocardia camponoti]